MTFRSAPCCSARDLERNASTSRPVRGENCFGWPRFGPRYRATIIASMTKRLVFLVPGFFGFSSVGALSYFHDVEDALRRSLLRRRIEADIIRCETQPTASIVRRAAPAVPGCDQASSRLGSMRNLAPVRRGA